MSQSLSEAEARTLKPGDRVYAWVFVGRNNGFDEQDMMEGTVLKVCKKTVKVHWSGGSGYVRYTPFHIIGGRANW